MSRELHQAFTALRAKAYEELFGVKPSAVFPSHVLYQNRDDRFTIDVIVYSLATSTREIEVAVTNGMSNQRMVDAERAMEHPRRELIQYFPKCTEGHARRLQEMAWLPLFDGFGLDQYHTLAWEQAAIAGTPWTDAFFLLPPHRSHREFSVEIEGDAVSFLWHIPITKEERAYKREHGSDALLDRMDAVDLPWIFDEGVRPSLLP